MGEKIEDVIIHFYVMVFKKKTNILFFDSNFVTFTPFCLEDHKHMTCCRVSDLSF